MNEKHVVLFDMDNTLISADTIALWEEFLETKGLTTQEDKLFRSKLERDYWQGCLNIEENFQFELSVLKRIPLQQRNGWLTEFFHNFVKPKVSSTGLHLIQNYKQQPETIVLIISATLSFFVEPVARYTHVDDFIATNAEIHEGDFSGRIVGTASLGTGKIQRFNEWVHENNISPRYITYYGDSINDIPLLELAHQPFAVDPDEKLKQVALTKNWPIISLKESTTA